MSFNKTQIKVMEGLEPRARQQWTRLACAEDGAPAISAIADMLQFGDTWEIALDGLTKRKDQYPKPVAIAVLYFLKRNEGNSSRFQSGLVLFKGIKKSIRDAAKDSVKTTAGWSKPDEWDTFFAGVEKQLKRTKRI